MPKIRLMKTRFSNTTDTIFENSNIEEAAMSDSSKVAAKFSGAKKVTFSISDLHMGDGGKLDDFKCPPPGVSFQETERYSAATMDGHFSDFVDWIIANLSHCQVRLNILGDAFDFSTVILPNESIAFPYEKEDVAKMFIIMASHPAFFEALRRFCAQDNCELVFVMGNHDWQLNWPAVQEILVERVSKGHPERVKFIYDELDNGVYYRHGESEPHVQIDPSRPIIKCFDLEKLPAAAIKALMTLKLRFDKRDILDVPLAYYLNSHLGNKIKEYNCLVERMHTHGFVYANAFKHIGQKSWFRSRWFAPVAAYQTIHTLLTFTIFARFWHIKWKAGIRQILAVIWWTITGALTGFTPRDSALRVLRERSEVDTVIYAHEHECASELCHFHNRTKRYVNVGTWSPQFEVTAEDPNTRWKHLGWLQRAYKFIESFFAEPELILSINLTVGVVVLDEQGEKTVDLARFDHQAKTLRRLS